VLLHAVLHAFSSLCLLSHCYMNVSFSSHTVQMAFMEESRTTLRTISACFLSDSRGPLSVKRGLFVFISLFKVALLFHYSVLEAVDIKRSMYRTRYKITSCPPPPFHRLLHTVDERHGGEPGFSLAPSCTIHTGYPSVRCVRDTCSMRRKRHGPSRT